MCNTSNRFVVLYHRVPVDSADNDHFDFMVQHHGKLATWRISSWPPTDKSTAEKLVDHRVEYLDYEGPLTDKRGSVSRVDHGSAEILFVREAEWHIELTGKFQKTVVLSQLDHQFWKLSLDQSGG